jgi:hypothetical protein
MGVGAVTTAGSAGRFGSERSAEITRRIAAAAATPAPSHAAVRDSDLTGVDFQRASTRRAEPSSFR